MTNADLPCANNPCPYDSVCCTWGVWISPEQKELIVTKYGPDAVVWTDETIDEQREPGWRTKAVNGKCVFCENNSCKLHGTECFPEYCRRFPYDDYGADVEFCPFAKKMKEEASVMLNRPPEITDPEWGWVEHIHKCLSKVGIRRLILAARKAIAREGEVIEYLKRNGATETPGEVTVTMNVEKT